MSVKKYLIERKISAIIIVIVALSLIILYYYPPIITLATNEKSYLDNSINMVIKMHKYFYISRKSLNYINVSSLISTGANVSIFSVDSIPNINNGSVIIFTVSELSGSEGVKPADLLENLKKASNKTESLALTWLNPNKDEKVSREAFDTVAKFFGTKNLRPILPLEPTVPINNDKKSAPTIHHSLYKAMMIAFTIKPLGTIIIEDSKDFIRNLAIILKWFNEAGKIKKENISLANSSIGSITRISGFKLVGYIGWITSAITGQVCGETTGSMKVKVEYYYGESGKYRFWLAYVMHGSVGYQTQCIGIFNHYPKNFISVVNWRTSTWPGQVLWDWGPKNMGTRQTISYYLSSGVSVGTELATASIEYSVTITGPNAPYYEWYDRSDPSDGIAKTEHNLKLPATYDESKLNNIWFQVEPSSIGVLDPDKPGGILPMIVDHYFTTTLNTGDNTSISFRVYLYPDNVYKVT